MDISFNLKGGQELHDILSQLPDKLARKAGETAVRAGANVLTKEVNAHLPHAQSPPDTGSDEAKQAMKAVTRKLRNQRTGSVRYTVVVRGPQAHLVEFGTTPHPEQAGTFRGTATGKKVLSDGTTVFGIEVHHPGAKAQPFFRPALDACQQRMLEAMIMSLSRAVARAADKYISED